jgi:hypothetical protein
MLQDTLQLDISLEHKSSAAFSLTRANCAELLDKVHSHHNSHSYLRNIKHHIISPSLSWSYKLTFPTILIALQFCMQSIYFLFILAIHSTRLNPLHFTALSTSDLYKSHISRLCNIHPSYIPSRSDTPKFTAHLLKRLCNSSTQWVTVTIHMDLTPQK